MTPRKIVRERPHPGRLYSPNGACQACGQTDRRLDRRGYCGPCTDVGRDTPWLDCIEEGCANTRRRRIVGEQLWRCPEHRR